MPSDRSAPSAKWSEMRATITSSPATSATPVVMTSPSRCTQRTSRTTPTRIARQAVTAIADTETPMPAT